MAKDNLPVNPIESRKLQVRRHSRNALVFVGVGLVAGIALGIIANWTFLLLGLIVAVVGGGYSALKVRSIINHRDDERR